MRTVEFDIELCLSVCLHAKSGWLFPRLILLLDREFRQQSTRVMIQMSLPVPFTSPHFLCLGSLSFLPSSSIAQLKTSLLAYCTDIDTDRMNNDVVVVVVNVVVVASNDV